MTFRLTPCARAIASLCLMPVCMGLPTLVQAGAATDGSVGAVRNFSGAFTVPQSVGSVRGSNLFHSFSRFDIGRGESATFTTTSSGLRNVIARVTGGEASLLEGPLRLTAAAGSQPNFWLINPSGITVGAGASFDVPAGLHLSTAQQLRFADGFVWDSGSATASSLTVAAPESFGFLGSQAAAPLVWKDTDLALRPGNSFEMAAGSVTVERSFVDVDNGRILLQSPGTVTLSGGSELVANAGATAGSGAVRVQAHGLTVDGSLLLSTTPMGAAGIGADVDLMLTGPLVLSGGAFLGSASESAASAGRLSIQADSMSIDGRGVPTLLSWTGANGGMNVNVAGSLGLMDGGQIAATSTAGGQLSITAGSMQLDGRHGSLDTGVLASGMAAVNLHVAAGMSILNGASVAADSPAAQGASVLNVRAHSLTIDGGGVSESGIYAFTTSASIPSAISIDVADRLIINSGGLIGSGSFGVSDAGPVRVSAKTIDITDGAITSLASSRRSGSAGEVSVETERLNLRAGGSIVSSSNSDEGSAGSVLIRANDILVEGAVIGANAGGEGARAGAGSITVEATNSLTLRSGGLIMSNSNGGGRAGSIGLNANTLLIDGVGESGVRTGVIAETISTGSGSAVNVQAGQLVIRGEGTISAATSSSGRAGSIKVTADSVDITGIGNPDVVASINANTLGAGNAGDIELTAREIDIRRGGTISSSTTAEGVGGTIAIAADRLTLDGSSLIFSSTSGAGHAGDVKVRVSDALIMREGGGLGASTGGPGAAGNVVVEAGTFLASGFDPVTLRRSGAASGASTGSTGQPGNVSFDIRGRADFSAGAALDISNGSRVAAPGEVRPGTVSLRAGEVSIRGGGITAASDGNVAAGNIVLASTGDIRIDGGAITTVANEGDGGSIAIHAGGTLRLRNSPITTSVLGQSNGNGGDIDLAARALVLESGFIQANTTAPLARGGAVNVDVGVLLPDGSNVFIGGDRVQTFRGGVPGLNVIQAAAPDGVNGTLSISLPQLNLSGALVGLNTDALDAGVLGRDPCFLGPDSTFVLTGRGGLLPRASQVLRLEP